MATLFEWPDEIHLIGVGGIGTHVLLALIELGAQEVHIWDDDIVSAHNRPTQFIYTKDDIGKLKVNGAVAFVERQGYDTVVIPHAERITALTDLSGIVISGVDTMASREQIWEALKVSGPMTPIYIDGRIGDERVHVLTLDPCNPIQAERYERSLIPDSPTTDRSCTTRANPHSAIAVASMVSMNLSLLLAGEPVKDAVYRDLRLEAISTQRPLSVN